MTKKREIIGLDLVDVTPDYSLTAEENRRRYRERYRTVYGEYPPDIGSAEDDVKAEPLPPRSHDSADR